MHDKYHVIINRNSGTVLRLGEEGVKNALYEKIGDRIATFHYLEGKEICPTLTRLAEKPHIPFLVGGGDGTGVCAAETLAVHGIPFGMLPLGTMNFLAQDLGAAPTFEETLQSLEGFSEDHIDIGIVNDRYFLCSAVIGLVPESAIAREAVRKSDSIDFQAVASFVSTIARGMGGSASHRLLLRRQDGDEPYMLESTSLIISNNPFIKKPLDGVESFLRESMDSGMLGIYSAKPKHVVDGIRMAFKLWHGDWAEDDAVISFESTDLIVESEDGSDLLISLDGEPMEMKGPLKFSIRKQALPVLKMELAS